MEIVERENKNEQAKNEERKEERTSRKALIFNVFYLIFAILSVLTGWFLGRNGFLGFINNPMGLPEAIRSVNGWSLLGVILASFFIFALFLEQRPKLWLYGTCFFLAMLTSSSILAIYPVTYAIATDSFIFVGESMMVGAIAAFVVFLLSLPVILLTRKKRPAENKATQEEIKQDDLNKETDSTKEPVLQLSAESQEGKEEANLVHVVEPEPETANVIHVALSANDTIRPAPPSAFTLKLHKDGIYLRSRRNYLPLKEQISVYGVPEFVYHGFLKKGYFSFIRIHKGREIDIPEESESGRGWTLEGKAPSLFKGEDVLECGNPSEKRTFNYVNKDSNWEFDGDEDKKYGLFIRVYDQGNWAVIYGQVEN